ncbi:hypothetical protein SSS_02253 [Sarcoptes scabiei]|nr:hypothetical protein SSS_02253 [Sarcoptes scabiei]
MIMNSKRPKIDEFYRRSDCGSHRDRKYSSFESSKSSSDVKDSLLYDHDDDERTDKSSNNSSSSISTIVANHYNSINNNDIQERKKSRIYHMRNFNNWVKSIIIRDTIKLLRSKQTNQDSSEFIVHDLACGKGGDLTKFDKSRITHFIGSDIAEISIEHCKERYRLFEKNFSAEFHTIDCTRSSSKID